MILTFLRIFSGGICEIDRPLCEAHQRGPTAGLGLPGPPPTVRTCRRTDI